MTREIVLAAASIVLFVQAALAAPTWNPTGYVLPGAAPSPFTGDEDPFCLFWDGDVAPDSYDGVHADADPKPYLLRYTDAGSTAWLRDERGLARREWWALICGVGEYRERWQYVGGT